MTVRMPLSLAFWVFLCIFGSWPDFLVEARTPAPWPLNFNNTKGVGPDGPWRVISVGVGFPDQYCDVYPGGRGATVLIAKEVCELQGLTCPLPPPLFYDRDHTITKPDNHSSSGIITPSQWDLQRSAALNLTGTAKYRKERVFLRVPGDSFYAENTSVLVSDSFALRYPGGVQVPLSVGLLSMGSSSDTNQVTAQDGTLLEAPVLLATVALEGAINSRSWGLHIGSVAQGINGSLYFGGYDESRILGNVASFDGETARLADIVLGPSGVGPPFKNTGSGFLSKPQDALLDASVPYMYLPAETCASIANTLPVSFNTSLGLYIWNTQDRAYHDIVTSLSYLSFRFTDNTQKDLDIRVPFALLNLTLESPLVAQPTAYFPCSPLATGGNETVRLGRAFLQAAFIAQNWESGKFFLAQAPGPQQLRPPAVKSIFGNDTTLQPPPFPPTWESTWASVLTPLASPSAAASSPSSSSLSAGARAGIGIGVSLGILAGIAGACLFFLKRRKRHTVEPAPVHDIKTDPDVVPGYSPEAALPDIRSQESPQELPTYMAHELPTSKATSRP